MEQLKKLIPDKWQGPKEILRITSNLFSALFVAQILGVDLGRLGLAPAVSPGVSGFLAALTLAAVTWISNHQREKESQEFL